MPKNPSPAPASAPESLLTVSQVAARHQVTRAAVHKAIFQGRIAAQKVGAVWIVTEAACEAYRPLLSASERGKANRDDERPRDKKGRAVPRDRWPRGHRKKTTLEKEHDRRRRQAEENCGKRVKPLLVARMDEDEQRQRARVARQGQQLTDVYRMD